MLEPCKKKESQLYSINILTLRVSK